VLTSALRLWKRAAQRALERAAPSKAKTAPAKKDFRRLRAANRVWPKHVAPLVNLARSAAGNGRGVLFDKRIDRARRVQSACRERATSQEFPQPPVFKKPSQPVLPENARGCPIFKNQRPTYERLRTGHVPKCPKMSRFKKLH